ncbi:NADPH-dependent FMN reductase [Bacillus massiliglaciei]|uniref:NADPH-dependent FMN reductase n=1 Tax=Bacillus massiliglaciei TaxID=1816693 RepID=UPI000AB56617|nr:NADPH-dependent FMN reductase [Bacillus massiliglaciei]
MSQFVILSGSPSKQSRIDLLLKHFSSLLKNDGHSVIFYSVNDFSSEDLFGAKWDSEHVIRLAKDFAESDGVIIGSPVYKASYTGVLKALMDLLPEGALKNKTVLPVMVGGTHRHLLAIDYSFKPLIAILKGQPLQGLYFVDQEINRELPENPVTDQALIERIQGQINELTESAEIK